MPSDINSQNKILKKTKKNQRKSVFIGYSDKNILNQPNTSQK